MGARRPRLHPAMSWADLSQMGLTVRPFSGLKPDAGNRRSLFSAGFHDTMRLLVREMDFLYAENIVVELDVRERDIRLDGYPRADARIEHPAVAVSFESKHGPLRYATCEFTSWADNLRAIALSMEALRAVDRYGVSKRGEQYQGWAALPAGHDDTYGIHTRAQAQETITRFASADPLALAAAPSTLLRMAIKNTHPDHGGDREDFEAVMRAKQILEQ